MASTKTKQKSREQAQAKIDSALSRVTQEVIDAIEKDPENWTKPWADSARGGLPRNVLTKKRYSGGNVFWLTLMGQVQGYPSNIWGTYKQWKQLGGQVRKGEVSTVGMFYKQIMITDEDDNGDEYRKRIPILRSFPLFNAAQVDGADEILEARFPEPAPGEEVHPIDHAEEFFTTIGADVRYGGDQAFYRHGESDYIQVPERKQFKDAESFYSTLAHEHVHWTGHPDRLNRTKGKHFGDQVYAREELVAELGSAFVNVYLGISGSTSCGHDSYLAHWLKTLKEEPKALWSVLGDASKALDFLIHEAGENGDTIEDEEEAA